MNIFSIEHILLNVDVKDKNELFELISNTLKTLNRITESKDFKKALEKRESEITTGIGEGLAIPHALHSSVLFPTLLYIRLQNAIEYDAIDKKPVLEVFVSAMPNSYQKEHLVLLSQIANLQLDLDKKQKLNDTTTLSEIYSIIDLAIK